MVGIQVEFRNAKESFTKHLDHGNFGGMAEDLFKMESLRSEAMFSEHIERSLSQRVNQFEAALGALSDNESRQSALAQLAHSARAHRVLLYENELLRYRVVGILIKQLGLTTFNFFDEPTSTSLVLQDLFGVMKACLPDPHIGSKRGNLPVHRALSPDEMLRREFLSKIADALELGDQEAVFCGLDRYRKEYEQVVSRDHARNEALWRAAYVNRCLEDLRRIRNAAVENRIGGELMHSKLMEIVYRLDVLIPKEGRRASSVWESMRGCQTTPRAHYTMDLSNG